MLVEVKIVVTLWRWERTGRDMGVCVLFLDLGAGYIHILSF